MAGHIAELTGQLLRVASICSDLQHPCKCRLIQYLETQHMM
jgi:hypothetical protein